MSELGNFLILHNGSIKVALIIIMQIFRIRYNILERIQRCLVSKVQKGPCYQPTSPVSSGLPGQYYKMVE
jgi:hypothetical protein